MLLGWFRSISFADYYAGNYTQKWHSKRTEKQPRASLSAFSASMRCVHRVLSLLFGLKLSVLAVAVAAAAGVASEHGVLSGAAARGAGAALHQNVQRVHQALRDCAHDTTAPRGREGGARARAAGRLALSSYLRGSPICRPAVITTTAQHQHSP